jgi:tetrahydromethanopterin S-methyltransferase subunit A
VAFLFVKIFISGPIYEPDEAKVFIYNRLDDEQKKRLLVEDVLDIIEFEFEYTQSDKVQNEDKGIVDNDEMIKYVQQKGKEKGKEYLKADIEKIVDIEEDYLRNIGVEIIDAKNVK